MDKGFFCPSHRFKEQHRSSPAGFRIFIRGLFLLLSVSLTPAVWAKEASQDLTESDRSRTSPSTVDNKILFEINPEAVQRVNLKISFHILKLAKIIASGSGKEKQ